MTFSSITDLEQYRVVVPFSAEGRVDSNMAQATELEIAGWTCPEGHMAVLMSAVLQASHPQAYYQGLFELAINDQMLENNAFSVYPAATDSPFNYNYWFSEGQKIQLRFKRFLLVTELCFNFQLYGKLRGYYMERE